MFEKLHYLLVLGYVQRWMMTGLASIKAIKKVEPGKAGIFCLGGLPKAGFTPARTKKTGYRLQDSKKGCFHV